MSEPGRVCPLRYHYGPAALAVAPERQAETLYVVGGCMEIVQRSILWRFWPPLNPVQ
ncbi:MAG: hypothetical protein R3F37_17180 [Candidatus Competibacteraceae bacterium]